MRTIKIQCFQHVHFEDLGCINNWIAKNGHSVSYTKFYENYLIPEPESYDWLIIMGGPMSVYDEEKFPWLIDEKKAIYQAIEKNKTVIGICLGSQLIADVLGVEVYKNSEKEIGWFDITLTGLEKSEKIFGKNRIEKLKVFHWHGDTYMLPENSVRLAFSECCENQAFLYKENVLALQFHLEVTEQSIGAMIKNGKNELINGKYIQSEIEISQQTGFIESNNNMMFQILDNLNKAK